MGHKLSKITLALLSASALNMATPLHAQETAAPVVDDTEVIQVSGIRASLSSALLEKRSATNLVEVIQADDVGKLPDQNLAEVLENITGVQITRSAGIGTGVQIRGTSANRVEINGVSTVGSGSGRNGISFEDINASIIAAVEVTKAPEAKTIEGSVGGTINLRTIRPLTLSETLGSVRVQLEDSSLSTQSAQPRFSAAFGDNWETDAGKFGFVVSGSYTEQEAVSFRPRADRDNLVTIDGNEFQGIQFFVQEQENDDYETKNLATTFEWAPSDSLKFHFDAIINKQERSRDSYRLQASGVTAILNKSVPSAFETINYGTIDGVNIGSKQAALIGTLEPDLAVDDDDPNLRLSSDTGARITDSEVFTFGGQWQGENLKVTAEISSSSADTFNPNLSTTLNFINPGCPLDATSNDNCVPFKYDLSGGSLAWGINFDSPYAPSLADLLDPNNVVLQQVQVGRNTTKNQEDAVRVDVEYYVDQIEFINSVDFGARFNKSSSRFEDISDNIGGFSQMKDSPNGSLFADLLVAGPSNYGDADGRNLFISDFLLLDPDRSFSDPDGVIKILQDAVIAHDPGSPDILNLQPNNTAFYNIEEQTMSFYAQANFEFGDMVRGNVGFRYIDTEIDSIGYGPDDNLQTTSGSYDFLLPRLNVVVTPHDDVVVRMAYGSDIRRPNFNQLATGYRLDTQENSVVALGNPGLEPEEVTSFDIGVEWYFAEAAVASIGYFKKERTNIFGIDFEGALLVSSSITPGGFARETDPSCPGGGIFNPKVVPGILGDPTQLGLCVDKTTPGNDPETTTQTGIEMAFQYDLSSFESDLGWASGFGVIANYTIQDFSGGSVEDCTSGRGLQVLGDVCIDRGLLDFSENAYNFTLYYEKFGLSARMRYTWREAFRTQDFAGGANASGSSTLSFPVVTGDRGQLNASISYDVTDKFNIGLEGVNLTEERIDQYCVAENALLCFVGLPDRRVTLGASYKF
ncbi:TonB-dependent receptor [Paraglaciecola hydrolytica]|uniref:TonB-dependent receptor n=1 Tax=Paraglaciecola hydrolytica TaxID=1799789 RepID=A0A148KKU7_9ALTE|nr:TonB-dependent receptor [Paraglaciecola hydrolytica]KXI26899.1 TonB-dependent receptor [Paraglaciecola hydrolytica]